MSRGAFLYYAEGDTPRLRFEVENQDVSGWSATLRLRREDSRLIERAGTIDGDGSSGVFFFQFEDGDLMTGCHRMQIDVIDAVMRVRSYPSKAFITVIVRESAL